MATILIVDDRPVNREYLKTLLGYGGHRLIEAVDGSDALSVARSEVPDLAITDILMPTMDGYEFVRQLRADPRLALTPVIFCTAHYREQEALALARACGVSTVLLKPVEPDQVLEAVRNALGFRDAVSATSETTQFDRDHLRLVTDKLSDQSEELKRTNERLSALVELGLQMGSELDIGKLLQGFCQSARDIVGARLTLAAIVGEHGGIQHVFTSGMDPAAAARLSPPDLYSPAVRRILDEGQTVRLHNPSGSAANAGLPEECGPVRSWIGTPIASPTRVYGWLSLVDKIGLDGFTEEDERLATMLSAQVGRVYRNGSAFAGIVEHAADLEREVVRRKQAEKELIEAEDRIQRILRSSPAVLFTLAVNEGDIHTVSWISDNAVNILGYPPAELGNPQWWSDNIHPEDRDRVFAQTLSDLFSRNGSSQEYRFRRADGVYRWIRDEVRLIRDAKGVPLEAVGSMSDVTEVKSIEEQLRRTQKMEAVGTLAAGVAHDFNNLLTVINGYTEMVMMDATPRAPEWEMLTEIQKAGERARMLTRQLLVFSRQQVLAPRVVDVNEIVTDIEKMLRRLIGEDIILSTVKDPAVGPVKADPDQLQQVLMNLAVNARDAMPQGGSLTIETQNVRLDDTYCRIHSGLQPGMYSMLAVTDTGHGMDDETRARIFEPFFTTKGQGHGTGLGLAVVHGIISHARGHVQVYSEVGHGTCFKVYLPHTAEAGTTRTAAANEARRRPRGTETILLVEDEEAVRMLASQILQVSGYTVLGAGNGLEAVQLAESYPEPIQLLISDVVMPHLGGRQLAERVTAMKPSIKVLFLSGYTDDAIVRHGVLQADFAFLQKPFTASALTRKVREVLDG